MWVRVPRLPLRGHGPTGRRRGRNSEIRVRLPVTPLEQHSPVVQRQRRLVHTQETMVRLHPGLLVCPGTPIGRAAWLGHRREAVVAGGCRFDSSPGHGPVGKLADHLGLEPGMLWVRVPPGPFETDRPRGAAWSARLPVTQEIAGSNPVEGAWKKARYANRQSGQAQTLVVCGFDSRLRHFRVVLLTAACKAVVAKEVRWMTRGSIPSQPTDGPFVYRHRMPDPRSGEAGSIPARATR